MLCSPTQLQSYILRCMDALPLMPERADRGLMSERSGLADNPSNPSCPHSPLRPASPPRLLALVLLYHRLSREPSMVEGRLEEWETGKGWDRDPSGSFFINYFMFAFWLVQITCQFRNWIIFLLLCCAVLCIFWVSFTTFDFRMLPLNVWLLFSYQFL